MAGQGYVPAPLFESEPAASETRYLGLGHRDLRETAMWPTAAETQGAESLPGRAKLYLLGGFRLDTAKSAPIEVASLKARALVAYLACTPGHRASREQLALLLWSDSVGRMSRQNLRQVLFKLRRDLAAHQISILSVDNDSVALRDDALWVDVWDYETLAGDGARAALERIGRLYRGEFLRDLTLDAPDFGDWLADKRAYFQDQTLVCLSSLIEIQRETGDIDGAIATAYRTLAIDPCHEAAHRDLMAHYLTKGMRVAALKQYGRCQTILRRELDVAPDRATEALYRRIRDQIAKGDAP